MESIKVKFNDLYPSKDGTQIVFNLLRDMFEEELQNLFDNRDGILELSWRVFNKRRSRNANAYHWALCGKLAYKLKSTPQAVHKELILQGSTLDIRDGVAQYVIYPDTYEPKDTEYIKMYSEMYLDTKKGKKRHLVYLIYKESHEMDSREFAELLENTIEACKRQGIETLPQEELNRMLERWKPK